MKNISIFILIMFLNIIFCLKSFSQTTAEVKNVDFTVVNDTMFITYDIDKIKDKEIFNVSVCIKTTTGKTITPKALTGDVGNNVKGGKVKKIVWAITKDNAFIDEDGFVEITAKPVISASTLANEAQISTGKAILLSTLVPGLGNTKISGGKPYWLLGVLAYGCLSGGVMMNLNSTAAYNDYKEATTETERDNFYNQAVSANHLSTYLFIGAGALWVGDLIFTAIHSGKSHQSTSMNKRISIGYNYDIAMKQPLMKIKYKL